MPFLIYYKNLIEEVTMPGERPRGNVEDIEFVQVTGEELSIVLSFCMGLPRTPSKVCQTWYGDHAKFIIGNLF